MQIIQKQPASNALIGSLPDVLRGGFLDRCNPVSLNAGNQLDCDGDNARFAYFPIDGVVCLRVSLASNKSLDVAIIGNEGMYGTPLWFGGRTCQLDGLVRQTGHFLRMDLSVFQQYLQQHIELREIVGNYVIALLEQMAQTAACVCFHDVQSRLATLLLMTHDRIHRDNLQITHSCLADIMGVRRSAITVAAGVLQKKQLMRYARGRIQLTSRRGMELVACECYRARLSASPPGQRGYSMHTSLAGL